MDARRNRRTRRMAIHWPTTLVEAGQRRGCMIVDVSRSGARITLGEPIAPMTRVTLFEDRIGTIEATVVWCRGETAGVAFHSLAPAVADFARVRMSVAMIVEADADGTVRKVMIQATGRMETALAEALGDQTVERARCALVAVWGLGLYRFLMRPSRKQDPSPAYLSWLAESSGGTRTRSKRSTARK